MQNLYKSIISKPVTGLKQVDEIIASAGMNDAVCNKLKSLGFMIDNLSFKQKAILFTSLVDIIVVIRDNHYYLATMCPEKIMELNQLGRLIPNANESDLRGVDKLLTNNTVSVINQYLVKGKFHLIKLNVYEKCRTSFTLVSANNMNPYPDLVMEKVYSLTNFANWHNELYNVLIKGIYRLHTDSGDIICQNYLGHVKSVCTGGSLIAKGVDDDLKEIPLWQIKSYEPYSENPFIEKLYKGIVKYDGKNITLNRELLKNYYGEKVVNTKLESLGVRYRYCLEELLSIGDKYSLAYYINKYDLKIYDCDDIYDLAKRLEGLIEKGTDGVVNARVLTSYEQIKTGHVSYYVRINLSKLSHHTIEDVEDITKVMPRTFKYYAISASLGYNCVEVKATSKELAEKYGEVEFKRQFGNDSGDCITLLDDKDIIKGFRPYKFSIEIQRRLCQNIMYGYRENYQGYVKIIREMLKNNGIDSCSDECIKLLYVNNLARKTKYGKDVALKDVMYEFLKFCELLNDNWQDKLKQEKISISYKRCCKEFSSIEKALPELKGYKIDDTPEGKYVVTQYGRFKIGKNGLNKTVELVYNDEYLGNKIIKG